MPRSALGSHPRYWADAQRSAASVVKVGIDGAAGAGKTRLLEQLLPRLCRRGVEFAIITDDLEEQLIASLQTHEQSESSLSSVDDLDRVFTGVELVLIENDQDEDAWGLSLELDRRLFVLDVAARDESQQVARGAVEADLLILNKIDLAPYVGADLPRLLRDFERLRSGRPILLTSCVTGLGVDAVLEHLVGQLQG